MLTDALGRWQARVLGQMDLAPCSGCDACGLRCAAGVQMSREEHRAVHEFVGAAGRRADVDAVARQDKAVHLGEGVVVELCRFRDQTRGQCAVYPVRPLICRLLGHVEWLPCPIGRIDRLAATPDALSLMAAYADEERRTWEEWERPGECAGPARPGRASAVLPRAPCQR